MPIRIVTAPSLADLEIKANAIERAGWQPEGAPFRDDGRDLWCQSMKHVAAPQQIENGDVKLREPERKRR